MSFRVHKKTGNRLQHVLEVGVVQHGNQHGRGRSSSGRSHHGRGKSAGGGNQKIRLDYHMKWDQRVRFWEVSSEFFVAMGTKIPDKNKTLPLDKYMAGWEAGWAKQAQQVWVDFYQKYMPHIPIDDTTRENFEWREYGIMVLIPATVSHMEEAVRMNMSNRGK